AGIVQGDLMLAFTMLGASSPAGSIAAPSGWTLITSTAQYQGGSHTYQGFYFYRIAGAAEPASYTFTVAGSPTGPFLDGNIRAYTGTDTVTPIGGSAAISASAVASIAVPAITETFAPGEWAVYCSASNTSTATFSSGSPNALSHNAFFNTGEVAASYAIGDFVPSQAPGAETLTWSGTGGGIAAIGITIRPLGAPPKAKGLSVANGVLLKDGAPYRAVGVNYISAFERTVPSRSDTSYIAGFQALQSAGIPFCRVRVPGYWPTNIAPYMSNLPAFFALMDPFVADAAKYNIGLIPSLFWNWTSLPAVEGESPTAWGDPNSKTIATCKNFSQAVAARYAGNPAIWAFEFSNEMNTYIGWPREYTAYPIDTSQGTPASYSPSDNLTLAQMQFAYHAFAAAIKAGDPGRLVEPGFDMPRTNAYQLRTGGSSAQDTVAQYKTVMAQDCAGGDLCSNHIYAFSLNQAYNFRFADDSVNDAQFITVAENPVPGMPMFFGECGSAVDGSDGTIAQSDADLQGMINAFVASTAALMAIWVFDYSGQEGSYNISPNNALAYRIPWITAANRALASSPTTGAHALAAQAINGPAGPLSIPAIGTQPSGSVMLAWVGRGRLADFTSSADPKDNLGATYGQVGSTHSYAPGFPNSGEALYS
ncbi:MAG: hypothetical protein ACREDH_12455, partial [Methylocella sp.]